MLPFKSTSYLPFLCWQLFVTHKKGKINFTRQLIGSFFIGTVNNQGLFFMCCFMHNARSIDVN